jgi:hypothetical protein
MRIHYTKLPKVQRFACSKRDFKDAFDNAEIEWTGFAYPSKSFSFDSKYRHVPMITGSVVAQLTFCFYPRSAHICFYPVARETYSDNASLDFKENQLQKMASWYFTQMALPETHNQGLYKSIIIEWNRDVHFIHELNM